LLTKLKEAAPNPPKPAESFIGRDHSPGKPGFSQFGSYSRDLRVLVEIEFTPFHGSFREMFDPCYRA
jgi:hypothetical protein